MQTFGAQMYSKIGLSFLPREMVALTVCAALSPILWFLLAKAGRTPRNVVFAILLAVGVLNRFDILQLERTAITFLVFPRGMFLIGCGFVAYAIYNLLRKTDGRRLAEAAFGIFALVPALRVFAAIGPFRYSIYFAKTVYVIPPFGYSIYYAIPLSLVFFIVISRCIKAATPALSVDRQRALINYLLAIEVAMLALICIPWPTQRTAAFETSWGTIRLKPEEANVAQQLLAFMSEQKRHGRKVAVLPEAPMFYALTGTDAPGRWYTLLPGVLSPEQEQVCLADLNRAAPDYILVTARRTPEYGADYFGIDYDQNIYHWIESNYRIAGEFGRFRREESGSTTRAPLAALLYEKEIH
jgi:hypothetical protein